MKQEAYNAAVAARAEAPAWPSADQAKEYLSLKGFVETKPGVWNLPSADHVPTPKQAECLRVLKAKTAAPPKALTMVAEPGKVGAA